MKHWGTLFGSTVASTPANAACGARRFAAISCGGSAPPSDARRPSLHPSLPVLHSLQPPTLRECLHFQLRCLADGLGGSLAAGVPGLHRRPGCAARGRGGCARASDGGGNCWGGVVRAVTDGLLQGLRARKGAIDGLAEGSWPYSSLRGVHGLLASGASSQHCGSTLACTNTSATAGLPSKRATSSATSAPLPCTGWVKSSHCIASVALLPLWWVLNNRQVRRRCARGA